MFRKLLVGFSILLVSSAPALAKRVALVIGNSEYANTVVLPNPVNDATAMATKLRNLGFDVVAGYDLDLRNMRKTVGQFARSAKGADIALLFYAGHGMQIGGQNYLVPVDASLQDETDLDFETMPMDFILRQMTNDVKVQLVFLDACRDNPLARSLARRMSPSRSATVGQGLAEIKLIETGGSGSVIAFSTSPGDVALDGDGQNSPFTTALLKHIDEPNASIQTVMTRVTGDVYSETERRQRPWVNASLIGEVFLNKTASQQVASLEQGTTGTQTSGSTAAVAPSGPSNAALAWEREKAVWDAAEGTGSKAAYEAYLRAYPTGTFAEIAREKITTITRSAETTPKVASVPQNDGPQVSADDRQLAGTEATEAQLGWGRSARREAQARLNLAGFNTGNPDGVHGPMTRRAINAWQTANDFVPTGYFTAPQYQLLTSQTQVQYVAWLQEEQQRIAAQRRVVSRSSAPQNNAPRNRHPNQNTRNNNNNNGGGQVPAALIGGVIGGIIGGAIR
ncbi:caspase family protein [uncultured Roseibium sp.]|uniref:caspase family protein n=1 Tax=uncultured Roseibium sp. TaxID=1936171 RepID=UPI003217DCA1